MAPSIFDDFQDVPNTELSDNLQAADDRTLRMASQPLDAALLESLVRYQETFLATAETGQGAESLASAHSAALAASGLTPRVAEMGNILLRMFSGRRWTARRLGDKLRQLEGSTDAKAQALREKIREELVKQEQDVDDLSRRFGADSVALLRAHEARLLDLHTRMTRVLTR